jgi:hypothetical protein
VRNESKLEHVSLEWVFWLGSGQNIRLQIWNLRTHKVIECLFLSSSTRGIHRIVTRRMRKLDHRPFFQGFPEQKACIMADYNETFKRHTMLVFHF